MKSTEAIYESIPNQHWHMIHFVRPRFKKNMENILLYLANECCSIPKCSCKEYKKRFFDAIRLYPGNCDAKAKTLHNWRTEIPALFSFYTEDKSADVTEASAMAHFLKENQDLTQFLRIFLYSFQFPGGHIKAKDVKELIKHGIRFKPARLIIKVLLAGNKILDGTGKKMTITAEEATYCIFNDTRASGGKMSPEKIALRILRNRGNKVKYYNPQDPKILSSKGKPKSRKDVIRYAGDILDYMEIANLLEKNYLHYKLKECERDAIEKFADDRTFYKGYDRFYRQDDPDIVEIADMETSWFEYVNRSLRPDLFKTDVRSFFKDDSLIEVLFEDKIAEVINSEEKSTTEIGNLGEAIICSHEKIRLKLNGYDHFVKDVRIVDSPSYHPGYDIDSLEADGTENHRYIEVKTTVSKYPVHIFGFHLSRNEWSVASTIKEHYCVYRLMLSENSKKLFILRDPVKLYKTDQIEAMPSDGMDITFSVKKFIPTELLPWKKSE